MYINASTSAQNINEEFAPSPTEIELETDELPWEQDQEDPPTWDDLEDPPLPEDVEVHDDVQDELADEHETLDDYIGPLSVFTKGTSYAQLVLDLSLTEVLFDKLKVKPPLTSPYSIPKSLPGWPDIAAHVDGDLSYLLEPDGRGNSTGLRIAPANISIEPEQDAGLLISHDCEAGGWLIWIMVPPELLARMIDRIKKGAPTTIIVRAKLDVPVVNRDGCHSLDWNDDGYTLEFLYGNTGVTVPRTLLNYGT